MKIHKLINNNIVIVLDEYQQEQIVMGKGLGFKKKNGDDLDPALIEKIFNLSGDKYPNKLVELLKEIPIEHIAIANQIAQLTKKKTGKKLTDSLIISLSDHIYTALERAKEELFIKNALLWEIKKFYADEYDIGKESLEIIAKQTGVLLPDDEAGFIALHIANNQLESGSNQMYEITKIMQEMINIVRYNFQIDLDEESIYFYRFITHLKFFAHRLLSETSDENAGEDSLLPIVREKYQRSFECAKKIEQYIQKNYTYTLVDEELVYLTIHIERVVQKGR